MKEFHVESKMEKKIGQGDFEKIRDYIHGISGIHLEYEKEYLVNQRLQPLLEERGIGSFQQLVLELDGLDSEPFQKSIINRITTNETSFFRDEHFFEALRERVLVPMVSGKGSAGGSRTDGKIHFWSAASSTGQEVYSLGILIDEVLASYPESGYHHEDFHLLATDINENNLNYTKEGLYNRAEVGRGLSGERRYRYFTEENGAYRISREIRGMVEVKRQNLLDCFDQDPRTRFDLILLRNVLIYFHPETGKKITGGIRNCLNHGGALMLGASENLYGLSHGFETENTGNAILYRKSDPDSDPVATPGAKG